MSNFERSWRKLKVTKHPFQSNLVELERMKPALDNFFLRDLIFLTLQYKENQDTLINALRLVSSALGLEFYWEPSGGIVTICGVLFVIDVDLAAKDVTISGTGIEKIDQSMNEYLTKTLKKRNLLEFLESLRVFGFLDKSLHAKQSLALFSILQNDIKFIFSHESRENMVDIVNLGHGYPQFYKRSMGPTICFFVIPSSISSEVNIEENGHWARITLEPSIAHPCIDIGNTNSIFQSPSQSSCEFKILNGILYSQIPTSGLTSEDSFVLYFDKPITIRNSDGKLLDRIVNGLNQVMEGNGDWTGPTFESKWNVVLQSKTPCVELERIGFSKISEIFPILQILRSSLLFEKIAGDLIGSNIKILEWTPSEYISVFFLVTKIPFRYSLKYLIEEGAKLRCELFSLEKGSWSLVPLNIDLSSYYHSFDTIGILNQVKNILS